MGSRLCPFAVEIVLKIAVTRQWNHREGPLSPPPVRLDLVHVALGEILQRI